MEVIIGEHRDSLLEHMVIDALTYAVSREESDSIGEENHANGSLEVQMVINGRVIDIERFVDNWQSQVKRMIREEALEMARDLFGEEFGDIEYLLSDLKGRLQDEVSKRLSDREKEDKIIDGRVVAVDDPSVNQGAGFRETYLV